MQLDLLHGLFQQFHNGILSQLDSGNSRKYRSLPLTCEPSRIIIITVRCLPDLALAGNSCNVRVQVQLCLLCPFSKESRCGGEGEHRRGGAPSDLRRVPGLLLQRGGARPAQGNLPRQGRRRRRNQSGRVDT